MKGTSSSYRILKLRQLIGLSSAEKVNKYSHNEVIAYAHLIVIYKDQFKKKKKKKNPKALTKIWKMQKV